MSDRADPSAEDSQTVFIPARGGGGSRGRYHIDPDCEKLNQAENTYEKARDLLDPDQKPCAFCVGDFEPASSSPTDGYTNDLSELDPQDLGLSPLGDRQ